MSLRPPHWLLRVVWLCCTVHTHLPSSTAQERVNTNGKQDHILFPLQPLLGNQIHAEDGLAAIQELSLRRRLWHVAKISQEHAAGQEELMRCSLRYALARVCRRGQDATAGADSNISVWRFHRCLNVTASVFTRFLLSRHTHPEPRGDSENQLAQMARGIAGTHSPKYIL
jgi:hypothetical protein